ncbi:uncharacterized protein UHO2_00884 [Ustilago hordei]|uniref:HECT-type E3 ubiquitin transferase n=1 Tax=Ustilago hordei TaxID=120017 RepID=I2G3Q1_USTHO|nr:uncharacterized protein UHO2_00884 [Ustilago hordei]CCF53794.1 uncharacterized protein UHOR_00135 [Ustilago hordei]SYW74019.1 uncharacterized protein UHO2_00884 [Ustilago hordei]
MDGKQQAARPVWGAKKSLAAPTASTPSPTSASSSSSSSAFPPLSSPQATRPSSRSTPHSYSSPSTSSLISPSTFNPYPTRHQELAQRAATNSTRKRSHITRSAPSTSRIHSLLDFDDSDDILMLNETVADEEEGEVSSRGATMSSIVFRDLSASSSVGTSRSSSPWQQGRMSAGLAMFASTSFGGEPLRVLANVDQELGAAHMGPRIYKRHNQKHVRNRVRAKIDAFHTVNASPPAPMVKAQESSGGRTLGGSSSVLTAEDTKKLRSLDLQKLVEECRRCHALSAIQKRVGPDTTSITLSSDAVSPTTTFLAAVQARIADPRIWSTSTETTGPILSDDLLPSGLQQPRIDFSALPHPLVSQMRHSVLQGLSQLLQTIVESSRTDLINTLSHLLSLHPLRSTSTSLPELRPTLQRLFLQVLDTFRQPNTEFSPPLELLSAVLHRPITECGDLLVDLIGELVGVCGQQMSSNPTILSESQDKTLVSASCFLSLCFALNATRPASVRLPAHAFYCTVLDLAPFLEHFVHYAASLARPGTVGAGLAEFNICRSPFLLSLGAKVRMLQLENEIRLSRSPSRDSSTPQRFSLANSDAELVLLPSSLNLRVERDAAWDQSRALFLQLLESDFVGVRGLRVEFAGEQAADGGGPAREWFATVASRWDSHRSVVGSHGWFILLSGARMEEGEEREAEDTAAFLGLLLALASLHTAKLTLPFKLPSVAFKVATASDVERLVLTPVDLEFLDATLAKSLQAVLDWVPRHTTQVETEEKAFDSTFSLTWSTSITTADGGVQTIDLVPGGRHRSVKLSERKEFVSKLIWRVLIGSVEKQVHAFREAWQTIMPSTWLLEKTAGAESATEILSRGGLALSLFSPEEVGQAILSTPTSSSSVMSMPLDVADIRGATDVIIPSNSVGRTEGGGVAGWFWDLWTALDATHQRRLLAFITGAEDLPATGARGIGLRIHLVPTDRKEDARLWPLPWSSTCTSTLFLPTYPSEALLGEKVRIAIEHYQGFGLR